MTAVVVLLARYNPADFRSRRLISLIFYQTHAFWLSNEKINYNQVWFKMSDNLEKLLFSSPPFFKGAYSYWNSCIFAFWIELFLLL